VPVSVTDLPEVLQSLAKNVCRQTHLKGPLHVAALDWTAPHRLDQIQALLEPHRKENVAARNANTASSLRTGLHPLASVGGRHTGTAQTAFTPHTGTSTEAALLIIAADCVWLAEMVKPFVEVAELLCEQALSKDADSDSVVETCTSSMKGPSIGEKRALMQGYDSLTAVQNSSPGECSSSGNNAIALARTYFPPEMQCKLRDPASLSPLAETKHCQRVSVWSRATVLIAYKSRSIRVDEILRDNLSRSFDVVKVSKLAGERRGSVQLLRADYRGRAP
jgi:hypothetical protein